MTVGTSPVAVVTYGTQSTSLNEVSGNVTVERDTTGIGYALTVNYGSNNVSLVNLFTGAVMVTVAVGNAPVAATVDSGGAYAYVANYASGTVSKVSLSSNSVVATLNVGPNPIALSMDASGNLWVGGNGYVSEYNTQSLTQIANTVVSGIVNSLAISDGQNKVLSNIIQPPTTGNPHARALVATSATGSNSAPVAQMNNVGDAYAASPIATRLPTPYLLGGGTLVSAKYGNNLSISATPTGFIVQDVHTGVVLASSTTSAPIRSIAVDQTFGYAYMTLPDNNSVLTFPMPGNN